VITIDFTRIADLGAGCRVLDVGCGSGRHVAAAYRLQGAMVFGVDPCRADLDAARDRLRLHDRLGAHGGGRWSLGAADARALPCADDAFDLVICSEVLEHVREDRQAVAEITRVLRPGGVLAVSVPRRWPERICWALSETYAAVEGGHVRIYRRRELIALLERAGARAFAVHHAHGLHTPFWWLKCLLGPGRENHRLVSLYHRFLTWDMLRKPRGTRLIEKLLNPVLGKSLVVYLRKK
jgi:SAM-dependent methyltransferase